MLTSLRIQNFRSIRDASVKLGQVNLFIGPNNSGKSNFLKGIEFTGKLMSGYKYSESEFDQILSRSLVQVNNNELLLPLERQNLRSIEVNFQFNSNSPFLTPQSEILLRRGKNMVHAYSNRFENESSHNLFESSMSWDDRQNILEESSSLLKNILHNSIIYKPDPAKFTINNPLLFVERFDADGKNINNFLFNLSQNHKELFHRLENDFRKCVLSLNAVSTPADPIEKGFLKLKFFDASGNSYWAEEVSEGVLYFLALLCIVHQPNPPKLLLLEEPEKGIHPRRIKEVMDFIFELARLRDIQIILTSHSPYVVDHFKDIPECISVFDRENGETVIHNAADIIKETNDKLEAAGQKPIRYTDALGEYWVSGFLGGVPL